MRSSSVFALLLTLGCVPILFAGSDSSISTTVSLERLLRLLATNNQCYFTVEYHTRPDSLPTRPAARLDNIPQVITNPVPIVEEMFPEMTLLRSPYLTNVYHVIAKPLLHIREYELGSPITVIYRGRLGAGHGVREGTGLASVIGMQLQSVGPKRSGLSADLWDDTLTVVNVSATNLPARQILTDFLTLSNRGPLLWRSETRHTRGRLQTEIQFFPPPRHRHLLRNDATDSRSDLKTMVREITNVRIAIQLAADAEWPHGDPANAAERREFQLPPNRPLKG